MPLEARPCSFGPFRLVPSRRLLEKDGVAVPLASRGFDILVVLIDARERVVSRSEIMASVWPGLNVEEHNLSVQMSKLRRALGDTKEEVIATVPGRGYRFVAPVDAVEEAPPPLVAESAPPPENPIPPVTQDAPRLRRNRVLAASGALAAILLLGLVVKPILWNAFASRPRLSMVILPFRALGDDAKKNDLADAITDDLSTDLSHLPGSAVTARASAETYKERSVPVETIGRALNVRYVIDGSIEMRPGTMRATVDLIDAVTGKPISPTEHYDSTLPRVWDAKADIERRALHALGTALVHAEVERAERERPGNQDALDQFFHARSVLDRDTELPQLIEAQHLLENAIAAEPNFVEALAALGWVLTSKVLNNDYDGYVNDVDEAERVTARARALAPVNPDVLAARGRVLTYRGALTDATAAFHTALDHDPNNVWALTGLAVCEWRAGKPDLVVEPEEKLVLLDPQSPATSGHYQLLGLALLFSGHLDQAIQALLRADAEDGDPPAPNDMQHLETTRLFLIAAYQMAGDTAEARRRYQSFSATWKHRSVWREMEFFNAAQERMGPFERVADALQAAGMPRYADEHEDDHVAPTAEPLPKGDFTPTPKSIPLPGGSVIDAAKLVGLLSKNPPPIVVDVGRQCVTIPNAVFLSDKDAAGDRAALEASPFGERLRAAPEAPIVVMGSGSSGSNSYNVTLHLLGLFHRNTMWFRGGEEAWAASSGMRTPNRCAD